MTGTGPTPQQHVDEIVRARATAATDPAPWPRWYRATWSVLWVVMWGSQALRSDSWWPLGIGFATLVAFCVLVFGPWSPPRRPRRPRQPITVRRVALWVGAGALLTGVFLLRALADVVWPWLVLIVVSGIVFYVDAGREIPEPDVTRA